MSWAITPSKTIFEIEYFNTNQSDHPVSVIFNLLSRIVFLKEFFTYNIYCILKKN